jgi:hypothetical protein
MGPRIPRLSAGKWADDLGIILAMPTLNLGVVDLAYSEASGNGATTTYDVAKILEANYGVMSTFFNLYQDKIAQILADSVAAAIQDMANGAPVKSPTFGGEQRVEALFREFIYSNTMQNMMTQAGGGVLSQAAQSGVSSRRKKPNAKRKARPAFVDTGAFVQSFRAWVEQ